MTRWTNDLRGGRDRGSLGLARAWVGVLVRPRRFFRAGVASGDQAPGLTFAMTIVLVEEASRLLLVEGAVPTIAGGRLVSGALALGAAVLLVAPLALHLVAGLVTVALAVLAPDRAGIAETVQVIGYSTAPCALAGLPFPEVRLVCAAYGAALLAVGLEEVHGLGRQRSLLAAALPAAVVFGYGFRGFHALAALLGRWYVIATVPV